MIVRSARYLLTRLVFLVLRLPVSRYRNEVERLWRIGGDARFKELDEMLSRNRPLDSQGKEVKSLGDLSAAPVLLKKQLRVEPLKSLGKSRKPKFSRHTAGTTGEPTHVSLNRRELAQMLGVRDYCFRHYGLKLGQREARLWGRPESGIKSWARNFVMNRRVFYPVGGKAEQEIAALMSWRPNYIYGYSSLLLEAAKLLDEMQLEFKPPRCVISTAESILPSQKAFISRVFKAPVAEEYGSTEFDVIAFECSDGHRHLVNPWLIVEDDKEGGVVSDLSRVSQDLIRYRLGDSFTIKGADCGFLGDQKYIDQLRGRTIDSLFFVNKSEKIHEIFLSRLFDRYFRENNDLFSFQMKQHEYADLDVFIDAPPVNGIEHLRVFLEQEISNIAETHIDVRIHIGKTRESSRKRNYFIQNMKVSE
jgi:phenylacetate-CoA ligase